MDLEITAQEIETEARVALDLADATLVAWINAQTAKATRRLFATCPTLQARYTGGTPDFQALVRDVVIDAVARTARQDVEAIGIKSESEDGYSYSRDPLSVSADIWFPDKDLAVIGCGGAGEGAAFVPRSARLTVSRTWLGG